MVNWFNQGNLFFTLNKLPAVNIGILGFGTVGEGTYRMLSDNVDEISSKTGARIEVVQIGVKDGSKPRSAPSKLFTTDLESVVANPDIDVILELIGGTDPAAQLVETALKNNKHVVTANKELIAKHGSRLIGLAKESKLDLHFEAAVGGGIPVIQPLKHQLAGNDVIKLMGILNGTTNFILTKMEKEGAGFDETLAEAQALGYAEADPSADIDGFDTMYKICILAAITFGKQVPLDQVSRQGIRHITAEDMAYAETLGYKIKLLGICEETAPGEILVRVHPTLVPRQHQISHVDDVYNAVWLHGDFVGDLMFSGRGAGGDPTASAVVGDLIDVVRNVMIGGAGSAIPYGEGMELTSIEQLETRYYIRLEVHDTPGTLGEIATAFGKRSVGLAAMEMKTKVGGLGEIALLTHVCKESDFCIALDEVAKLPCISKVENWIRVEN